MLKTLIRQFHSTLPALMPRGRTANPGVARQIRVYDDINTFLSDPEGFGDMESDFMDVHKSHKQLVVEEQKHKDKVRSIMIKHKYFREPKMPNLLTYAEKEQIRLLHARDPEEWSIDRLTESFPATPGIIQKILEAKWRPRSIKRIKAHDEAVIRNWEQFQSNNEEFLKLLSPSLKEHLKKFSQRTRKDLENIIKSTMIEQWPTRPVIPKPNHNEFQMIIAEFEKKDKKTSSEKEEQLALNQGKEEKKPTDNLEDETYLLDKVIDKRKMRLEDLKKYKLGLEKNEAKAEETEAIRPIDNPSGTGIVATNVNSSNFLQNFGSIVQYESNEIVVSPEDQKRYEMSRVKDRIYIPRKLRKKGATYRIEDCYYDDDGEFLYRVPGMVKTQKH